MKIASRWAGLSMVVFFACCGSFAQAGFLPGQPAQPDPFTINFDENGKASVSIFGGASYTESGFLAPDVSGSLGGGLVLTYALPEFVGGGGVSILDVTGAISDNLYFYAGPNNSFMEYTSQAGGGQLADTGVAGFFPVATERANDTFTFVAGSGDPASTNFYNGVSSPSTIPEPASFLLMATGLGGLALYRRSRRQS